MEQMRQAYILSKENFTAVTMLSRNMKVKVHLPHEEADFYVILAGFLVG